MQCTRRYWLRRAAANSRMIYVQFRGIADKDLDQFRQSGKQVIVAPDAFKTGEPIPFNQAHK